MAESDNPYDSPKADLSPDGPQATAYLEGSIDAERAIIAEGILTERDLLLAHILHASRRAIMAVMVAMVVAVILVVLDTIGLHDLRPGFGQVFSMLGVAGLLSAAVLGFFFFPRLAARRVWRRRPTLREPFRRLFTAELVQTMTPVSNVNLRWSVYSRYRRSDQLVLLYLRDHAKMFTIVPRHAFRSEDQWQQFLKLVEEKLPEG